MTANDHRPEAGHQPAPWVVAVGLLRAGLPGMVYGAPQDWPRWRELFPHVLAVTDATTAPAAGGAVGGPGQGGVEGELADSVSWLLDRAGTYLQTQGQPGAGAPLMRRALAITEAALGPDHPGVGASLNNLAGILQDLGEQGAARPLAERALTITETALGPDHPTTRRIRSVRDSLGPSPHDLA